MKNYKRLTLIEREEISRGLASDQTLRQIANSLARPPSTVSRELSRLRYNRTSYNQDFTALKDVMPEMLFILGTD